VFFQIVQRNYLRNIECLWCTCAHRATVSLTIVSMPAVWADISDAGRVEIHGKKKRGNFGEDEFW